MNDEFKNPYGEALAALDELKKIPRLISIDSSGSGAQLKAMEAVALSNLAAADAMLAARNEMESLGAKIRDLKL